MTTLAGRLADLSPADRASLTLRVRERQAAKALGDGVAPLSFAQERVWFLQQREGDNPFYNLAWANYLSGPLDVDALRGAYGEVVARHGALRTRFVELDGVPWQIV